MNRSNHAKDEPIADECAVQHGRAPRPLPLFLSLVQGAGERDPALARAALAGLRKYEEAERVPSAGPRPAMAEVSGAALRDHGGDGPPAVLVPSLINPPRILDLDSDTSLAEAVRAMGRRVLIVDWGEAAHRRGLDVAGHVEQLLVPLLRQLAEPAALAGYCLGGTIALAAANLLPVERVATIAAPWHFSRYPSESSAALAHLWASSRDGAKAMGMLPMEVLQGAFWSLDPDRTVAKFAAFGALDADDPRSRRFVTLEDWANEGEALPYPAARELIEDLFGGDRPGQGTWRVGGRIARDDVAVPLLHLAAGEDRIAPATTAPDGPLVTIAAGHVGMVVGSARTELHAALASFLAPASR
jgi:polyhydroxyalkanoate synthase